MAVKKKFMKKIIEESGMTARQFSKYYEIPYQTVNHWLNGTRQAPAWAVKLMREKIEREKCGSQLSLFP